jgi:hypothetical protein
MTVLEQIIEQFSDEEFLVADGLDEALVGIVPKTMQLVYDTDKIIEILMNRDGMSEEDAFEYFYYNIEGAYVGEETPIFIMTYGVH